MDRPWILCSKFLTAIEIGDVSAVTAILDSGFDIDRELMNYINAISFSVSNGYYIMAKLLISRGCSLSLKNKAGETPLHLAVLKSHYDLVKLVLENRADITSVDKRGKTALHHACENNNLKIASLLADYANQVVINMKDHERKTSLYYACQYGSRDLIECILHKGGNVLISDIHGNTPLIVAMSNDHVSPPMINLLLNAGSDVNYTNASLETALLRAVRLFSTDISSYYSSSRFREVCLLLIERGSNVNAKNDLKESALHLAVILQDEVLVRKLLNSGSDANATNAIGFVPLFYACRKGTLRIATLLMDSGANLKYVLDQAHEQWVWFNHIHSLQDPDSFSLLIYVLNKSRECPTLSHLCRIAIRKSLVKNIDKTAQELPLPQTLVRFVQLD